MLLARLVAVELFPAADFIQDAFDFIRIALPDRFTVFAEALTPNLHDTYLASSDSCCT